MAFSTNGFNRRLDCIPNLEGNPFLLQDWRDSHLAYLQHKTALNRPCRPSSAGAKETTSLFTNSMPSMFLIWPHILSNCGLASRKEICCYEYGLPWSSGFRQFSNKFSRSFHRHNDLPAPDVESATDHKIESRLFETIHPPESLHIHKNIDSKIQFYAEILPKPVRIFFFTFWRNVCRNKPLHTSFGGITSETDSYFQLSFPRIIYIKLHWIHF